MLSIVQGVMTVAGRLLLCAIFFASAVGQKIPRFNEFAAMMEQHGLPAPKVLLAGAIVFLIVGSLSVVVGFKARLGALLLLVFLGMATYYFHNFWAAEEAQRQMQQVQFMKNLSMMGAMLLIIANGAGPMSFDARQGEAMPTYQPTERTA